MYLEANNCLGGDCAAGCSIGEGRKNKDVKQIPETKV